MVAEATVAWMALDNAAPLKHPLTRIDRRIEAGSNRLRACGQIGGGAGAVSGEALAKLRALLRADGQLLPEAGPALVADFDACWLGRERVSDSARLHELVRAGRLAELRGAFALAWRDDAGVLNLARDAIGERSLVYAQVPGGLIFATNIHALLATRLLPRRINRRAVASYLTCAYIPGRETLVEGVFKLLPGEHLRFANGELTRRLFWTLPAEAASRTATDEAALCKELREVLETALARRMADGEARAATLSGGIDSSLVVALAMRLGAPKLKTFSISFGAEYRNELPFSSLVAEHCGTEHRILELTPAGVLANLDETIARLIDPIGDPLTVPNTVLFKEAAADAGAVLNGEGGDPSFGGPKNQPMLLSELYEGGLETGADATLARERSYLRAHQKCFDDLDALLEPAVRTAVPAGALERELSPWFEDPRWPSFVNKLMALNLTYKGGHHILPKVDALSIPFGVTPRSPLFDQDLVELAFRIQPQLKLRGNVEKYLLKRAVADLLPESIISRPKSGMLVPVEGWFQGPLLKEARARLLDGLTKYGVCQRSFIERLLDGKVGVLKPRRGVKIWLLVTLESWLRGYAMEPA